MTFDFDALLLGPIYSSGLSCAATLIVHTTVGGSYPITVLDKTSGAAVEEQTRSGHITIETIKPMASVRQSELALNHLAVTDLENAELTIQHDAGSVTWRVKAYQVRPTPSGPGEVDMILMDENDD